MTEHQPPDFPLLSYFGMRVVVRLLPSPPEVRYWGTASVWKSVPLYEFFPCYATAEACLVPATFLKTAMGSGKTMQTAL